MLLNQGGIFMKRIISIVLCLCLFTVLLSSCSDGINSDEAKSHINGFFAEIEVGDYQSASKYLHIERPANLELFFEGIEKEKGIDFQQTITVKKYTGFSSSYFDSTVWGSTYSLDMVIAVGDDELALSVEVVRNNNGFGIYNLDIDG